MRDDIIHGPIWLDVALPEFPALTDDVDVDIAVVGGGLTGLMTAWLLAREGRSVALFERDRLAAANTARSTAHLTCVTDLPLHEAAERLGESAARAFWEAGTSGIDFIARTVVELQADCDFRWTPGYLHVAADRAGDAAGLKRDAALAAQFGLDATFLESVPGVGRPGVRFDRQAIFHPRLFAAALARSLAAMGGAIHEHSALERLEGSPPLLQVNSRNVRCGHVVLASESPLLDPALDLPGAQELRRRLQVYTSFVLAAVLPTGTLPAALYWDTADPYEYLRVENTAAGQLALFGGLDVPVGEGANFGELETRLQQRIPGARPTHAWSGQLVQSDDGLPYVGSVTPDVFVATGFCGNGFTLGSVAAMMARDTCLGRVHPCADLFHPLRGRWHGKLWRTLSRKLGGPAPHSENRPASS